MSRSEALEMMKERFNANPTMFGFWTGWEPNAFDGKDDVYKDKMPSDKTGRFVPYLTRKNDGTINLEPLLDYEVPGAGDFYQKPKKALKPTVIPPYSYPVGDKIILMMSLTSPMIKDGVFYGVTGTDIDLTFFQELADTSKLPAGSRIIIYDTQGTIVALSDNPKLLLKNIFQEKIPNYDVFPISRLKNKDQEVVLEEHNLSVLSKIKMLGEEWVVEINTKKCYHWANL